MSTNISTKIADRPGAELPVTWYVHKHRREHEAAAWDERRVQVEATESSPVIAPQLLIKFVSCVVALTAALGAVVTLIR